MNAYDTGRAEHRVTADELIRMPDDDLRYELVQGQLVREPPTGGEHGWIGINLAAILREFVGRERSGLVFGADTGFILARQPDTVRAPDVAFVAAGRLPAGAPRGFVPFAPDLAVEIVSPHDRASDVTRKVLDYIDAGTRIVWIIDPSTRTAVVHRGRSDAVVLRREDTLDGGDVLPGFRLMLNLLFDG